MHKVLSALTVDCESGLGLPKTSPETDDCCCMHLLVADPNQCACVTILIRLTMQTVNNDMSMNNLSTITITTVLVRVTGLVW